MAEPLLKIKSNFSFRKLANQIEGIIGGAITDEAKGYIIETKRPIEEGTLAPLKEGTIQKRKAGISDYMRLGHEPKKTNDKTPLTLCVWWIRDEIIWVKSPFWMRRACKTISSKAWVFCYEATRRENG